MQRPRQNKRMHSGCNQRVNKSLANRMHVRIRTYIQGGLAESTSSTYTHIRTYVRTCVCTYIRDIYKEPPRLSPSPLGRRDERATTWSLRSHQSDDACTALTVHGNVTHHRCTKPIAGQDDRCVLGTVVHCIQHRIHNCTSEDRIIGTVILSTIQETHVQETWISHTSYNTEPRKDISNGRTNPLASEVVRHRIPSSLSRRHRSRRGQRGRRACRGGRRRARKRGGRRA